MKKFLLIIFMILLAGCVASQDEIQTLKIKVINLETTLTKQQQNYETLKERIDTLNKKVSTLENKLSKDLMVEIKTQVLSDLEDIKTEQAHLSSQLEDLKASQEEEKKEFSTKLETLSTQVQALELKVKELEKKLELPIAPAPTNATTTTNATVTANATVSQPPKPDEGKPLNEAELYEKAYSYYQKGDFKNARTLFEEYVKTFPKGKWVGQAYFWIGESYFKEKKYEDAILNYQKLIELPGWHPLKPTAMFNQAQAFRALGDVEAYKILLKKIITQYPNSKEAQTAKNLLKNL